jgi:uncharacterized lipoprotein YmbA
MRTTLTLLMALLLAACAGKPSPTLNRYLLETDASNAFNDSDAIAAVSLGSVRVASYIDQPGIVLETADGTVTPARNHQWAQPLRESLREFLANEISAATGKPVRPRTYGETNWKAYTKQLVDVRLEKLHGTSTGDVTLTAYWAVIDPGARAVISEHEFSTREPLGTDGYAALVTAAERALKELAQAIAGTL